ncbi:hypothetical protein FACS1894137_12150 [Spirochaetia bacterium]|nr:hypothetical protein FACS1894137_12150 [Spirochaetia bacterium]
MQARSGDDLNREQGNNKAYTKTYTDKGGGKAYTAQTGDIPGMDFPIVNRIVPGLFMGQCENLCDYNERNHKRCNNNNAENKYHAEVLPGYVNFSHVFGINFLIPVLNISHNKIKYNPIINGLEEGRKKGYYW